MGTDPTSPACISGLTSGGPRATALRLLARTRRPVAQLHLMRVDDGGNQTGKASVQFHATRGIVHFHTTAFAADQPCLAQHPKVLRQRGFRDVFLPHVQVVGTVLPAAGTGNIGKNRHSQGIGQGMQQPLDGHVLDCRVEQGSHKFIIGALDFGSIVHKFRTMKVRNERLADIDRVNQPRINTERSIT
jgi:hypothetical protein